ncbi:crossover junction endonuclease EME1B-like [Camellia sinensis]|uniref:crossover junction endonuclease EME1B-like n=1 Tax=Camellia sinensis TaxID=4442 RepID=UPI00103604C4|nr:crossover junction endonuclease EME1B-like [Camellia sinensis]
MITRYVATILKMYYLLCVREQGQYKNPANCSRWRRPPVEEVLSKLATHFFRVHSRLCVDEAELAEHVVGLTCSLASCQFRYCMVNFSNLKAKNIVRKCNFSFLSPCLLVS